MPILLAGLIGFALSICHTMGHDQGIKEVQKEKIEKTQQEKSE